MIEDLPKVAKELEKAALTSINVTTEQWEHSIAKHFTYPKDTQLCKLYAKVAEEFRAVKFEPFKESLDKETMGPGWRW